MNIPSSNNNKGFVTLRDSFQRWDGGVPSDALWDDLEAELSVHALWEQVSDALEEDHNPADDTIMESFEKWSPQSGVDGWSKLDEQLSRERVWIRLNQSLDYPIRVAKPWLKMVAVTLLFTLIGFYTDFSRHELARNQQDGLKNQNSLLQVNENLLHDDVQLDVGFKYEMNPLTVQLNHNQFRDEFEHEDQEFVVELTDLGTNPSLLNEVQPGDVDVFEPANNKALEKNSADLVWVPELVAREVRFVREEKIEDLVFAPITRDFKPRVSIQLGGQFAFINEVRRTALTSSLPSVGISAEGQYHLYLGKLRFSQNLGFSQYTQSKGTYLNGRYMSSNQKLNMLYLSSTVGYRMKHVTVFGGVSLNKMLSGHESNSRYITNIYKSDKVQVGAIAGIDYHFTPFKNNTALGLGVQYQVVSKVKSSNTVFQDLQGLKLQIKYSF